MGGQRVQEMDHFVESTATPIVRLVLPGASAPEDSRDAVFKARKVRRAISLCAEGRDACSPLIAGAP